MSFKFQAKQVVATRGVAENIPNELIYAMVFSHWNGDWGSCSDVELNESALKNGDDRLMSVFTIGDDQVWVITEWDRSVTTVLYPDEY